MTYARGFIASVLLAFTLLTGITCATAQVVVKADDLLGTWEEVSTKDLKTGDTVLGTGDTSTGLQWIQYKRSQYRINGMTRNLIARRPDGFATICRDEKNKP